MNLKKKLPKHLFNLLLIVFILLVLTQLQPWIVRRAGGVAGSFGVRSVTHACLGITYENGIFPPGAMQFTLGYFHFRYSVDKEDTRPLCIGQDIWYGE
ncbi:MAG: hypothetical protein QM730_06740 [Anaerolineales bacterium]